MVAKVFWVFLPHYVVAKVFKVVFTSLCGCLGVNLLICCF